MKKLSLLLALCLLLLALPACGNKKPEGLLSQDEIAKYESLYFSDNDAMLKELALGPEDVNTEEKMPGLWPLKATRPVDGNGFRQALLVSETEPMGLYGVRLFSASISHDRALELAQSLYDNAVELYGRPGTYPGTEARLSEGLENGSGGMETWDVGEKTTLTLRLTAASEVDGDGDMDTLELTYQVRTLRDGQPVDPVTQKPIAR